MGNTNIVEKIVHVEDKEQMKTMEERIVRPPPPPLPLMSMTVMDTVLGKKDPPKPNTIYPSLTVPIPNPNNPIASTYMVPWDYNNYNIVVYILFKFEFKFNGRNNRRDTTTKNKST